MLDAHRIFHGPAKIPPFRSPKRHGATLLPALRTGSNAPNQRVRWGHGAEACDFWPNVGESEGRMIEQELVERCRRGDRSAEHEVYTRTADRIYRLLVRVTRSSDAALDLAQETYVRAFTRIGQFDGQSSFYTWLCRIAINEALQLLRRREIARAHRESVGPGSNYRD